MLILAALTVPTEGQAALGDVCWSREGGVVMEGCAQGTRCEPWILGEVNITLLNNAVSAMDTWRG